jgi:hypothetical protein
VDGCGRLRSVDAIARARGRDVRGVPEDGRERGSGSGWIVGSDISFGQLPASCISCFTVR